MFCEWNQGVNFSIELSWLLKEVYAYWCVYLMDTFIKILPEKTVILFTCTFCHVFTLTFLKENCHFWSRYTNNYLIDNRQNNWWYSVPTANSPKGLNYVLIVFILNWILWSSLLTASASCYLLTLEILAIKYNQY